MRSISLKLFLLAVFTAFTLQCFAQVCTGSLGDPVINQTFGSGTTNPGPALPFGTTNMAYVDSLCPNDGQYAIISSIVGTQNCHESTWYSVSTDHTGNRNGYMMLVNASYAPSIFYTQPANGLCPNTTYEFSAYILNLIVPSYLTAAYSEPNITFTIKTTSGVVLATDTTGTILPSALNQGPTWNKYGTYFTTPADVTDVVVLMTNNAPGGNGNDFLLDDITFKACGPIIETGFATTTGPTEQSLCQGSNANYTLKADVIGENSPSYQWQVDTSGYGWKDIAGQTSSSIDVSFVNAATGVYQYRLGVSNGSDISVVSCRVYSPPLTVYVNPLPVVPAFPVQTFCEGSTLTLTALAGISCIWTGPNLSPTMQNPLIIKNVTQANAGTYSVQAMSDSGCTAAPVEAIVKITPKVVPVVSNDVGVCAGESTTLSASGGLYYKWTPSTGLDHDDIANPVATPLETTTYHVDISNDGCSDSSRSVTVTVWQLPVANAGSNKTIYQGQSVKLDGTEKGDEITSVYWTPAANLDNPQSLTPIASPTDNTTYTLNVVSQNCGSSTSSVYIRVYKTITIPNTFSPNNDGINDNWDINELITYPNCTVMIYDRYGQKVYQSIGYPKPWNGTYNGTPLPQGTYYYIIDLKDGRPPVAGWVLIVR